MAGQRKQPADNPPADAEAKAQEERERAEQQAAEEAKAAQKREREEARASDRKSYPDEAEAPPPNKKNSDGETTYLLSRMIEESQAILGVPSHIAVGAFHGYDKAYVSEAEGRQRVEAWLGQEVS